MSEIVVLGPTGNTGSALLRLLLENGHSVRTGNRKDFDFFKPETYELLFRGASHLFLILPLSESMLELASVLIKAARAAGISRIVKLSAYGANRDSSGRLFRWHAEADKQLEESGVAWSLIRPNAFMQNFMQFYGAGIREGSRVAVPCARARVSFIDAVDVARVAYHALFEDSLTGRAISLTGPGDINFEQATEILSFVLGKPVRYIDVTESETLESMRRANIPEWRCEAILELYSSYRSGDAEGVTNEFEMITGSKPRSLHSFFMAHREEWI